MIQNVSDHRGVRPSTRSHNLCENWFTISYMKVWVKGEGLFPSKHVAKMVHKFVFGGKNDNF